MKIICDLYNLHLKSGRQYLDPNQLTDEQTQKAPLQITFLPDQVFFKKIADPDDKERKRIIAFFEEYCPEVLTLPDAQSVEARRTQLGERVTLEGDEIWSLGGYQHTNKKIWFESEDYLDFVDHWRNLRILLDSIIIGELDMPRFLWFREYALHWKESRPEGLPDNAGYTLSVNLADPDGNLIKPSSLVFRDKLKTVPLGEWRVEERHRGSSVRYGINIGELLYGIHHRMIRAMEQLEKFRSCAAPDCNNIFISKGNKKYHLSACATRTKQTMDKKYKVEQRLPNHQKWAQWLAKLPMNREFSARDIILELDGITSFKHGLNGHKVGALLSKKGLRQELEKLGVTYKRQKAIRGSVYTFRET